ncbi:unnamed protein product, partial [Mesorhabditis belari]|uniref:Sushi, von Willebrand factor type A, EGF and pentraxin domain-containing protein 1 n=1 Tax=Mesorhabditis belari TaxID=2138241 RepID=A0AAF3FMA0_9BILA
MNLYILTFFILTYVASTFSTYHNCPQPIGNRPKHCKKSCENDEECKGHKRCLCDGECGLSCVNPSSTCHPLDHLENGYIRTSNENRFGSNAEYSCQKGYVLIGPSQRRCQASKDWSGSQPLCRLQLKCGPPPELPYAVHDGASFSGEYDLETEVQYSCVPGYHRFNSKGLALAKCLLNRKNIAQWFGPDLKCKARTCSDPGRVENGIREGDVFEYPHQVVYKCLPGFLLVGPSARKCESNGEWTETTPVCKATECPRPPDPLHGRVLGASLTYQSTVTYSCKDGYRLVGQVQRICLAEGIWAGQEPRCEEIRCPSLPSLSNGYIEGGDTHFGAIAVFRCYEKMTHEGATEAKCLQNGQWSHPPPKCLGVCRVPSIENGRIESYAVGAFVQSGSNVQVKCEDRHETKSLTTMSCHNASWSHLPICEPLSCHTWPPRVAHARVLFTKSSHGSRAKYECKPGFRLNSPSPTIKCLFGEWIRDEPPLRCISSACEHPMVTYGKIENGKIMLEGLMGPYDFADYIQKVDIGRNIIFQCEKGFYLIGSPKASCVNGEWKPKSVPRCQQQTHPMVDGIIWNRSKRSIKGNEENSRSSRHAFPSSPCPRITADETQMIIPHSPLEISVACREGYEGPNGQPIRLHCSTHNNTWIPLLPICFPKSCRIPARLHVFFLRVNDSQIIESNGLLPDSTIGKMVCIRGFQLKGNAMLKCNKGLIEEAAGECVPQECLLDSVPGGKYIPSLKTLVHAQKIILQCQAENVTIECNRGILQPAPSCFQNASLYCVPPQDTTPAIIFRLQGEQKLFLDRYQQVYPSGSIFQYRCDASREEASGIECVEGKWISNLLPCLAENVTTVTRLPTEGACPEPPLDRQYRIVNLENYVQSSHNRFPHGTSLQIGCSIWAPNDPIVEWKCRRGKWGKRGKLACPNSMACEFKTDLTGRTLAYSVDRRELLLFNQKLPENSKILYRCSEVGFFRLRGKAEAECREGEWSVKAPRCEPLDPKSPIAEDAAPIFFTVDGSQHAISHRGDLIVARSATITFSCLLPKSRGKPVWETTSTYRSYPQSWEIIDAFNYRKLDAYQLTVAGAQPEDNGVFNCITPFGERHSIKLIVQNVNCPPLRNSTHLHVHFTQRNFYVGTVAQFVCPNGYRVTGARKSICLMDGRWSHEAPECQAVQCPPLVLNTQHLSATVSSFKFGGISQFSCDKGYTLIGNEHLHCTSRGTWSERVPYCAVVQCGEIFPPRNGFVIGGSTNKVFRKGDIVMFGCADSHLLTGTDFVMCQASGKWSKTAANCSPYCKYPGTPEFGQSTSPPKDYYLVGDKLVYYCPGNGYRLSADNVLVCVGAGRWSRSVPRCVPSYDD